MSSADPGAALPVTLIGGYLGAGKTTLVNHLLRERAGRRIAVLVNDFGELSIDDDLIESTDGKVMRLAGGCVCCSFGNDLMAALMGLPQLDPRPDHVLLETSGVALPGAVARTLRLLPALALDAVVVLADAQDVRERAADPYVGDTVRQQLADADLVVLNKSDLVDSARLQQVVEWLHGIAPAARVLPAAHARLPPAVVMGTGLAEHRDARAGTPACGTGALQPAPALHAAELFDSLALAFGHAVDCAALARALAAPELRLVRAKGLMRDLDGAPRALQLVGARAEVTPSGHARPLDGRLVCIALRGQLDRSRIAALVAQCAHAPGIQAAA